MVLAMGGSAAGLLVYYQYRENIAQKGAENAGAGFDLASIPEPSGTPSPASPPATPADQGRSGLGMIQTEPGLRFGSDAALSRKEKAARSLKETSLRSGARVSAFTARFRKKHPVMLECSREWMSHPDLKKLNDDYFRDRDPVKFIRGLAMAPGFGLLVRKYAADPRSHALVLEFVTGVAKEAPADLRAAVMDVLKEDDIIKKLAVNILTAFGLPSTLVARATDKAAVDQKELMNQLLKDHPELRQASR